ncbi:solute carrier 35 member [Lobaria immixta]|nr:solute carrier 35 member [Lobaria immixta]
MGNDPEKERVSADIVRPISDPPILPTVNPALEKIIVGFSSQTRVHRANRKRLAAIVLTTWHLTFATIMTQILSRTTTLLDGRKTVKMTGRLFLRAIVPIAAFYSLSLISGNLTYLYLSVAFIQMLKATTPVAVVLAGWAMGAEKVDLKKLFNVSIIVIGVVIASFGEIRFVLIGFIFQLGGICFEAVRLVLVQNLLSSAEYKMDPLVSLYYFAPVCAIMNSCFALIFEVPRMSMAEVYSVGLWTLFLNALIAFALNVSVVFLIGRTSSLVLTLSGVLKDIFLVAASIAIWGTPISGLQYFGYSIALCGLIYYKLGGELLKAQLGEINRAWAEYGVRHPALRKLIVFGSVLILLLLVLGGIAPRVGYDSLPSIIAENEKTT